LSCGSTASPAGQTGGNAHPIFATAIPTNRIEPHPKEFSVMEKRPSRLFFDSNDYKLLTIVNDVLKRGTKKQSLSSLMAPYMHPHGIKEMAAPSGLRIAYAIVRLLGSLEAGKANDRIVALRSLREEVFSSSTSYYHKNTARVLMQIMKELVRSEGDELRQLQLAHDFRTVFTGTPWSCGTVGSCRPGLRQGCKNRLIMASRSKFFIFLAQTSSISCRLPVS
jgi:hypothetical protein